MTVRYKQIEYHQVHLHKEMAVDEDDIVAQGLTVEQFKDMLGAVDVSEEDYSDEDWDKFWEIAHGWAEVQDSDEDWFSDRKGGYDIDYELLEEGE